jgi:hypothetical protein
MIDSVQNPALSGPAAKLENQWPPKAGHQALTALVHTSHWILLR